MSDTFPPDPTAPFAPARVRAHRRRAAVSLPQAFLHQRLAEELAARLGGVNRRFERALVIGGAAAFRAALEENPAAADRIGWLTAADWDPRLADVVCDPERLSFGEAKFDLVVSLFALHWVNDLPGALIQIRRALRPDGLFLAGLFGGATLNELRGSLIAGESAVRGGAGGRIAPFADARDLGGLLQRAGFALPVTDAERLTVRYAEPFRLFQDLRAMGETSALAAPHPPPLTRDILAATLQAYADRYALPDGRLPATFETLIATGWAPHDSQQKPLKPGSAQARLADALGAVERPAGERAG